MSKHRLLAILVLVAASGCEFLAPDPTLDPTFGNASRHNLAVQVVDPDPATANDTSIALDGQRMKRNLERYYQGDVVKPEAVTTK